MLTSQRKGYMEPLLGVTCPVTTESFADQNDDEIKLETRSIAFAIQ
jgi:hypothetical protein